MKKLYIQLSKNSNRLAYYNENGRNVVSIHGEKRSSHRLPLNTSMEDVTAPERKLQRHLSLPAKRSKTSSGAVCQESILMTSPAGTEPKIVRIAELQRREFSRSRGSSEGSELTLVTSFGRPEEELAGENPGRNRAVSSVRETNVDEPERKKKPFHPKRKHKCTCLNCDKRKKGIASLTKRCLFKSQTPTFESIAKKIRLLPNATIGKLSKDWERTDQDSRKYRLSKANSFNTISNSSLQDLDESEFTSSELAEIMGQLKKGEDLNG